MITVVIVHHYNSGKWMPLLQEVYHKSWRMVTSGGITSRRCSRLWRKAIAQRAPKAVAVSARSGFSARVYSVLCPEPILCSALLTVTTLPTMSVWQRVRQFPIGDVLHRTLLYAIVGTTVGGMFMIGYIHNDTMRRGRGACCPESCSLYV